MKVETKSDYRKRRHYRIRRKIRGTAERPRMSVFLSNQHLYVQFIDDEAERTLVAVSTTGKEAAKERGVAQAEQLGRQAALAAKEKGIVSVVFDRGGFRYGGRLRALADAARKEGLTF